MCIRDSLCGADGPHSVNRLSQGIYHPAQHSLSHRHIGRAARAGHDAALPQAGLLSQQDTAHAVPGQVHDHALNLSLIHILLRTLSLTYNRARQSAITQEITEIASGAQIQGER